MAKQINKNRMFISRLLVVSIVIASFLTTPIISDDTILHHVIRVIGYLMLITCAIGRIYSSMFIGGHKNDTLIKDGPYSACRNPLYLYTMIGAVGIGFAFAQLTYAVILFVVLFVVYYRLIIREEVFLEKKIGDEYTKYKNKVPRVIPDFSKFKLPKEMVFQTKYINYAIRDAVWWFMPYPLYELISYLHSQGIVEPLVAIW